MPVCKKCNTQFTNRVTIDGKKKNLNKRKYCLTCSPFKKHNTKQLHLTESVIFCATCGKHYNYNRRRGDTKKQCGACSVNLRRFKKRRKAVTYKGGKCIICGYTKCIKALNFHHLNPEDKDFQISGNHCRRWEAIQKELDKCVLVCANCHAEVHDGAVTKYELRKLENSRLNSKGR